MKTLYVGAGLALAGGLLLGTALRPQLEAQDPAADPQAYASSPGAQTPSPFDDPVTYAAYANQTPDYVIGTDSLKILAAAETPPAEEKSYYDSPIRDLSPEPQTPVARDPTAPGEGAAGAEHGAYPSAAPAAASPSAGDAARDATAEAPAEAAPQALPIHDDEPMPEATGDTRVGQ